MTKKYRIWLDQDSTIYDLSTPWYQAHNEDHEHILLEKDITTWNTQEICRKAGCDADIYSYFEQDRLWTNGGILGYSNAITKRWLEEYDISLGIITTTPNSTAATLKLQWIEQYFPHIEDVIIVNGHLKHLVAGDILIDDGIHNLTKWNGIGILYSAPWNYSAHRLRAHVTITDRVHNHVAQWIEVDRLVRKSISLLEQGFSHKVVEAILASQQDIGI